MRVNSSTLQVILIQCNKGQIILEIWLYTWIFLFLSWIVSFVAVKDGQDVYLEVFHTELEAFKHRVREYAVNSLEPQNTGTNCRLDPKEARDSLPPVSAPALFVPVQLRLIGYCSYHTQLQDGIIELLHISPLIHRTAKCHL